MMSNLPNIILIINMYAIPMNCSDGSHINKKKTMHKI